MLKFENVLDLDAHGVSSVEDLQSSIQEAMEEGADAGPGIALALVSALAELQTAQRSIDDLKARLESTQLYVIGLETRLVESGLRFEDPTASINPSDTTDES